MQLQLPQLWLLDLRPLMQDERWRAFLPELPIERQTRARSCRREEDAARLTGAGFLLQQALLSLNIPVSEQIFRKNDWGKPYLVSRAVEFSLTARILLRCLRAGRVACRARSGSCRA